MKALIVVDNPRDWPLEIRDVTVVAARSYLTDPATAADPAVDHAPAHPMDHSVIVINLCKSYHYQSRVIRLRNQAETGHFKRALMTGIFTIILAGRRKKNEISQ